MSDYQTRNLDTGANASENMDTNMSGGEGTSEQGRMQRVQDGIQQAREVVSEKVSELRQSATRMTDDVSETVRNSMDRLRTMDQNDLTLMYDDVLESARQNPGRAIMISAAVGVVLGMMLRGNNRNY